MIYAFVVYVRIPFNALFYGVGVVCFKCLAENFVSRAFFFFFCGNELHPMLLLLLLLLFC